ncbi:tetratricopeptide repeat protein [Streptomyces albus]
MAEGGHGRRAGRAGRPAPGLAGHRDRRHPAAGHRRRRAARPAALRRLRLGRAAHPAPRCTGERGARLAPRLRRAQLADALSLARGPLLADRPEGRYGWLAHHVAEAQHPLLVADLGLALAAEHLRAQDPDAAVEAVRAALRTAPDDERLWDELVRAAHATEDAGELDAAVRWVVERGAALHGPERGVSPRTAALLDELAPGWTRTG